jgi:hypothetical protein
MRGNCTGNWWRLPSDITQRLRARMPIWPQKKAGGGLLENTIVRLGLGMKLGNSNFWGMNLGIPIINCKGINYHIMLNIST